MNCQDFQKIIHELADYRPISAAVRDAGVSHIALCAQCAAKLANASCVSNGLVMATSAESEAAPARIKDSLLAAFTELHQAESRTARVVDISRGHKLRWWTAAAVAAAAVIVLAVILPAWREASAPDSRAPASELKAAMVEPSQTPETIDNKRAPSAVDGKPGTTVKNAPGRSRGLRPGRADVRSTPPTYQTVAQNTGEYLPLTYLAKATDIDSGTIVRVNLSRSALASLGLPMSFEGTGALVKAEVVIGDDGVARAIRLVQ